MGWRRVELLVVCALAIACRPPARHTDAPAGRSVTDGVTVQDGQGATVALAALRRDVTVIALWASYCGTCEAELPALEQLARAHADDAAIAVVAINVDEPELVPHARERIAELAPSVTSRFAERPGMIAALLPRNDEGKLVIGLPAMIVIDRRGHLHAVAPRTSPAQLAELIEIARKGELPARAPVHTPGLGMKLTLEPGLLRIEVLSLPRNRDEAIAELVLFATGMGAIDTPALREELAEQLEQGRTIRIPLPATEAAPP